MLAATMLAAGWVPLAAAQTQLPPAYNAITTDAVVFANCFAEGQRDPILLSLETLSCAGKVAGQQQTAIARYPNEHPILSDAAFGPEAVSANETYAGAAHASAEGDWKLGASANDSYTCSTGDSGVGCSQSHASWGIATLSETFEVYAPSPPVFGGSPTPGSHGALSFTFQIVGSATGVAVATVGLGTSEGCFSSSGCGRIDDYNGNGYTLWYLTDILASPTGVTFYTFPYPIPFSFSGSPGGILPTVVTVAFGVATIAQGFDTSSSSASFADTMTLSEIDVQDENGMAVSGYRILTGSNTDLSGIAVGSVPEPSAPALFGASLAGLAALRIVRPRCKH